MKSNLKAVEFGILFLVIFLVKMVISTAPVFLDLDKKVVKAVILQLELDNNAKETSADSKDHNNPLKKGIDFIHYSNHEISKLIILDDIDYHFISKKYINTFFPIVPTPPPNLA